MERERVSGILLHPTSLPGRFGIGNLGAGEAVQHHDYPNSMLVNLPPLAALFFKPER